MQLKGTRKVSRTIGQELGVRYVLAGSVRKAGNSLRITAQLIDVATDAPLWSDKVQRDDGRRVRGAGAGVAGDRESARGAAHV